MGDRKEKIAAATALSLIVAVFFWAYLQRPNQGEGHNRWPACVSHLRQLALASIMYQGDNDDRYEPPAHWMDCVRGYIVSEELLRDPSRTTSGYGYAHDGRLLGLTQLDLPDPTAWPLIYDSSSDQRNASDPFTSLPYPSQHSSSQAGKNNIAYTDGHVKSLPATPNSKTP